MNLEKELKEMYIIGGSKAIGSLLSSLNQLNDGDNDYYDNMSMSEFIELVEDFKICFDESTEVQTCKQQ